MNNEKYETADEELPGQETPLQWRVRFLKQVLMMFAIGLGFVVLGMATSYPNAAVVDLRRDNSTLFGTSFDLEAWEEDMMGSILSGGGLAGTWLGGWALRRAGRKRSLMALVLPCVLAWGLVALSLNPGMLLTGRFLCGVFSGMMSVVGNVYAVELPDTNVRGFLAMIPNVMVSAGLVASVSLGLCLRWFEIPAVAVGVFLACFASVSFVPESPTFLAVSGRESEARKVLRRLRGPSADVEEELKVLKDHNQDKAGQPIFRLFLQRDVLRALVGLTGGSVYGILALQLFTPMQTALTTPGLYWFYGGVSIAGILFCCAFVRETMRVAIVMDRDKNLKTNRIWVRTKDPTR
ncbi:facilitated trehalose transporter Tret1-like [Penaeus indicus]|uniref:facilitated trehalose transporter Tret1-like n=1 Tax=Penaeus indicus TaxID=29960 RepID=UPI00300D5C1E